MFMEERQQEIAEAIARSGKILIAEIVEKYHISDESARRDLRMLEQKGLCKRTHGGAIRLGQINMIPPRDRDYSAMPVFENYRRIARQAVKLVQENDVIYLTSGSFGFILLSLLRAASTIRWLSTVLTWRRSCAPGTASTCIASGERCGRADRWWTAWLPRLSGAFILTSVL